MTTKLTTYSFVFALYLLTAGINGSDVGLPAFVTGKRAGFLLLMGILFLQPRRRQKVPQAIQWTILTLCFVIFWANLSCIVSEGVSLDGWVATIVPWGMITCSVWAFARILPRIMAEEKKRFIRAMVTVGFLVNVLTIVWVVIHHGVDVFYSPYQLSTALVFIVDSGINRHMNGMLFWNLLPMAVVFGVVKSNRRTYLLLMIGSVSFFLLSLFAAVRQATGGVILYGFVLVLLPTVLRGGQRPRIRRGNKGRWLRAAGVLVILTVGTLSSERAISIITERMLDKTRTDYQTDDGRIVLLRDAWSLAVRNPFFGVGNFLDDKANSVGKHPHNGYAKLLASHGFPPLIAMLMLLSGCIVWAFFKRKQAGQHQDLWYASYSFLIVYLVWAINFNDILREFMLSFVLVLMICSIRCGAPHAERNANVDPTVIDEPSKPLGLPIVPK